MNKVFGFIAALGLVLILGTAGASDLGNISLEQAALQASIGLILFAGGVIVTGGGRED